MSTGAARPVLDRAKANTLIVITRGREIPGEMQHLLRTGTRMCVGRGGDDHRNNTTAACIFGIAPFAQDKQEEERRGEERKERERCRRRGSSSRDPRNRRSRRKGRVGQVSRRLAAASHLGRVGRASCCYSFSLARAVTLRIRMHGARVRCHDGISMAGTYVRVRTCVRAYS